MAAPLPRVAVVSGASRPDSNLSGVVTWVQRTLDGYAERIEVRVDDLAALDLPVMQAGDPDQLQSAAVQKIRGDARWADGFILITPEYHGTMSGALKNWFDFLWHELAGKFAGVISVTGGGTGDMSTTAVRNCFSWCNGFTLPFNAAARRTDFDDDGNLGSTAVQDRIERVVHDVVRYGPVLRRVFDEARATGTGTASGVAGFYPDVEETA